MVVSWFAILSLLLVFELGDAFLVTTPRTPISATLATQDRKGLMQRNEQLSNGEDRVTTSIPHDNRTLSRLLADESSIDLENEMANIQVACQLVIGKRIEYYEHCYWTFGDIRWEIFFVGFPNQKVLTIHWTDDNFKRIDLNTTREVEYQLAKDLQRYQPPTREAPDSLKGIVGATLEGVYLAVDESMFGPFTRLFFDLGKSGWLELFQYYGDPYLTTYELYSEMPGVEDVEGPFIKCL